MKARLPIFDIGAFAYDWLTAQPIWRQQIAAVLDHVPADKRPIRVLDLGCGPGVSSFVLAETLGADSEIIGIDNAKLMIQRANRWHAGTYAHLENVRFQAEDATNLPFDDTSFDLAVGHSFLYLVPDRVGVLREVRRVLKDDGALVLMEPNRDGSIFAAAGEGWQNRASGGHSGNAQLRFGTSMALWRVASGAAGRMHPDLVRDLFADGGFAEVECHPTLAGLGLHCVGRGRRAS